MKTLGIFYLAYRLPRPQLLHEFLRLRRDACASKWIHVECLGLFKNRESCYTIPIYATDSNGNLMMCTLEDVYGYTLKASLFFSEISHEKYISRETNVST